ncbi:acyl carrier protein [Gammaproteobacteria bacterium]|nr:acyl carrier protein [Gammaproteobacteria bacterium]
MNIEDRVKKIVSHQFSKSLNLIENNSSFINDLGGDSLDTVELVMAIEEEFDLEIIDDDVLKILTVSQAVDYIKKHTLVF